MIKHTKITLLFGLPGSGKTTALSQIIDKHTGWRRLSGGSLISVGIPEVERDKLRKLGPDEILLNQEKLVMNFLREVDTGEHDHVIFDGHCMVKDGEKVTEIPLDVIKRLCPDQIIFFDIEPKIIAERRTKDTTRPDREVETVIELEDSRKLQKKICKSYVDELKIPLAYVDGVVALEVELNGNAG